jgi:hypothetical protein
MRTPNAQQWEESAPDPSAQLVSEQDWDSDSGWNGRQPNTRVDRQDDHKGRRAPRGRPLTHAEMPPWLRGQAAANAQHGGYDLEDDGGASYGRESGQFDRGEHFEAPSRHGMRENHQNWDDGMGRDAPPDHYGNQGGDAWEDERDVARNWDQGDYQQASDRDGVYPDLGESNGDGWERQWRGSGYEEARGEPQWRDEDPAARQHDERSTRSGYDRYDGYDGYDGNEGQGGYDGYDGYDDDDEGAPGGYDNQGEYYDAEPNDDHKRGGWRGIFRRGGRDS